MTDSNLISAVGLLVLAEQTMESLCGLAQKSDLNQYVPKLMKAVASYPASRVFF